MYRIMVVQSHLVVIRKFEKLLCSLWAALPTIVRRSSRNEFIFAFPSNLQEKAVLFLIFCRNALLFIIGIHVYDKHVQKLS